MFPAIIVFRVHEKILDNQTQKIIDHLQAGKALINSTPLNTKDIDSYLSLEEVRDELFEFWSRQFWIEAETVNFSSYPIFDDSFVITLEFFFKPVLVLGQIATGIFEGEYLCSDLSNLEDYLYGRLVSTFTLAKPFDYIIDKYQKLPYR